MKPKTPKEEAMDYMKKVKSNKYHDSEILSDIINKALDIAISLTKQQEREFWINVLKGFIKKLEDEKRRTEDYEDEYTAGFSDAVSIIKKQFEKQINEEK